MLANIFPARRLRSILSWLLLATAALAVAGCDSLEERIQRHYENGLQLVEKGEPVKAGLEFRNALKLNNDFAPALYSLAQVEFGQGEYLRAAGFFKKVTELDPNHAGSRADLARIYLLAGQLDDAVTMADEALALEPGNPGPLVTKAAVAMKLEQPAQAVRFADQALEMAPDNIDALTVRAVERLSAKDLQGALAYLDRGKEGAPGFVSLQMLKLATLEALSDDAAVEKVLIDLVELEPGNAAIRYGLARWYFRNDRRQEAEDVIRQFAEENPDNHRAGLNLVRFQRQTRGNDAARAELLRIIEKSPPNIVEYKLALAELSFSEQKNDSAIAQLEAAIKEHAGTPQEARVKLFLAARLARLERSQDAKTLIDSVLDEDEKNTDALQIRAALLSASGDYDAAVESLVLARDLAPQSTQILRSLSQAYEQLGKVELAEDNLIKAVQIEEFKPELGLNLTRFLYRHGKSDHAENVLDQVIERAPENVEALTQLAQARLRRQQWSEAIAIADKLAQSGPGNEELVGRIRAAALAGQRKYDASIQTLTKSLEGSSEDDKLSSQEALFRIYLQAERYDDARALIQTALEEDTNDVRAYIWSGVLAYVQNDFDRSEANFKKALEVDPKLRGGHYSLTDFYLKRRDYQRVLETSKAGLEHHAGFTNLRYLRAQAQEKLGQYQAAIAEYEILHDQQPGSLIYANNLASLLSEYGNGAADLDRALEIAESRFAASTVPQFLDTLGWIYYLRGDIEKAVSFLKRAGDGLPNLAVVQYHLGMAYKALGRSDLAVTTLERAKALSEARDVAPPRELLLALESLATQVGGETQ